MRPFRCFDVGRARLGELAGEPAQFDHRAAGAKGQHHRHLQQHLEHVADVVGVEFGEAFGAVAALQQKGLAGGDRGQPLLEPPGLAGKHQRREIVQGFLDPGERAPRRNSPAPAGSAGRASCPEPICRSSHNSSAPSRRAFGVQSCGSIWSCITSGAGGRCTIGDIRISESLKHESRLGSGRLRKKRKGAILGRRPVPAVPKSRDLAAADSGLGSHHRATLAGRGSRRKRFLTTARGPSARSSSPFALTAPSRSQPICARRRAASQPPLDRTNTRIGGEIFGSRSQRLRLTPAAACTTLLRSHSMEHYIR